MGIPFQDLKSLFQVAFNVEKGIAQGLWTNITPSPKDKGKKLVKSSERFGKVITISYQH